MKELAIALRVNERLGYGSIAKRLNLPLHKVRDWVKHIPIPHKEVSDRCRLLAQPLVPVDELKHKGRKRKRLIAERGHRCEQCGLSEWLGKPIMLELHNHRESQDKCKLLCPNCHSQTDDWRRS